MTIQKRFLSRIGLAASALSLGACTVMPTGPTTLVMPGRNATMDSFRFDDSECRQYAYYQIGGVTAQDAANQSAVGSAVVGTAIGALAGAAVGGRQGAAVGAGVGLVGGSAYGANSAYASGYGTQRQYNHAYIQCMYVKGHSVPVPAGMTYQPRVITNPQSWDIPPPPPGMPPPPPGAR